MVCEGKVKGTPFVKGRTSTDDKSEPRIHNLLWLILIEGYPIQDGILQISGEKLPTVDPTEVD